MSAMASSYALSHDALPNAGAMRPPALRLLARELVALPAMRVGAVVASAVPLEAARTPRAIMVLPGLMAGPKSMSRLIRSLRTAGHDCFDWGLGRNMGVNADLFERLSAQIDKRVGDTPVTLVGWSLGGLMAREFAKHAPHRVEKVLTLGSPFSGNLKNSNHAWRVYQLVAGHDVEQSPIAANLAQKPPMETIALWSTGDGIVNADAACGSAHERDLAYQMNCTHMGMGWDRDVIVKVGSLLNA